MRALNLSNAPDCDPRADWRLWSCTSGSDACTMRAFRTVLKSMLLKPLNVIGELISVIPGLRPPALLRS